MARIRLGMRHAVHREAGRVGLPGLLAAVFASAHGRLCQAGKLDRDQANGN